MNPIARSATTMHLSSRSAVRCYSQVVGTASAAIGIGAGGRAVGQTPSRVTVPSACSCGGAFSSQILPLQIRRGAARSAGKRSPTVRRAQNAASRTSRGSVGGGASSGPTTAGASGMFPKDSTSLIAALKVGLDSVETDLTEDECAQVILNAQRLEHNRAAVNEAALLRDYNLTPYKLHTVGVLLLIGNASVQESTQCFMLATSMMHMAASLGSAGYMPSVLTIINLFGVDMTKAGQAQVALAARFRGSHIFQSAEEKFLAYLAKANAGDDSLDLVTKANAFTLSGLLAEASGNLPRALRWFQAARLVGHGIGSGSDVGSGSSVPAGNGDVLPRDPKWDWERKCLEAIGRLQMDEADVVTAQEAREALRTAALALNSGKACMLLAAAYARDPADRTEAQDAELDTILQRAAVAGEFGAIKELVEREATKANDSGMAKDEAAFHFQMADEWRRLAEAYAATESEQTD
ncbi:hypothetical protein HMPREF1624_00314 [Sporothrix schenckii ATCC 58251]|uniref:Uncharacterized protein n=1 Tax=Sporothrix schenckii (strain ATCC 58251 / de Perez 2211183) TaxID=1391915 RepID=U7Q2A7_SPOS1|nr:hypothetical protein HMPREF1624_00314 [Sporothrix schenckii ATCC 58251]